jgi:vacuolar protein sorting-associated protein 13D
MLHDHSSKIKEILKTFSWLIWLNNFVIVSIVFLYFSNSKAHFDAEATYVKATPNCHMTYHWPRLDKEQLLCVRIVDVPSCMWSGGIKLHGNHSLTINVRDASGKMYFLRIDVVLQESTYFIVFTDAVTMPPPIRVDNFSEVNLMINQVLTATTNKPY